MTHEEAVRKIDEQRKKGWFFEIHADVEGWGVRTVGMGLATGQGGGSTLEEALEFALKQAFSMEDDPEVLIKRHGDQIKKIAGEVFGEAVVIGDFEILDDCDLGPKRIGLHLTPKVNPEAYVDLELKFYGRLMDELPREAYHSFTCSEEWLEDQTK